MSSDGEGEFTVEKVLDKRIRDGVVEYFLKWQGYPDSENTWEPADNLQCPALIAAYEKEQTKLRNRGRAAADTPTPPPPTTSKKGRGAAKTKKTRNEADITSYNGWEAEKVLGATLQSGELKFLIKWKDCDEGKNFCYCKISLTQI